MKQQDGRETWYRLLNWDKGPAASERLAAQILINENFDSVDPSHPLGGKDGLKDILCQKEERKYIVSVYFPRGQMNFKEIKRKFLADSDGIKKNGVDGIVFITNQELRLKEREDLKSSMPNDLEVLVYHLERISTILNSPNNYGTRLEFLDIEMTKEEQLAYMASKDTLIFELNNYLKQIVEQSKGKVIDSGRDVNYVIPEGVSNDYIHNSKAFHKCSFCGYGYKIVTNFLDSISGGTILHLWKMNSYGRNMISCPKCGNTEEYYSY